MPTPACGLTSSVVSLRQPCEDFSNPTAIRAMNVVDIDRVSRAQTVSRRGPQAGIQPATGCRTQAPARVPPRGVRS